MHVRIHQNQTSSSTQDLQKNPNKIHQQKFAHKNSKPQLKILKTKSNQTSLRISIKDNAKHKKSSKQINKSPT